MHSFLLYRLQHFLLVLRQDNASGGIDLYCDDPQLHIWHDKDGTRIGIDCGSGFRVPKPSESESCFGRLACLRLDDMKEFYSD